MTQYVRQQLVKAQEYLAGNRPHLAADCVRRAMDGLESVESELASLRQDAIALLFESPLDEVAEVVDDGELVTFVLDEDIVADEVE